MRLFKIIIDTCVIVSALKSWKGASYKILSCINKNLFNYGLSVPLYYEYEKKRYERSGNKVVSIYKKDIYIP